MFFNQGNTTSSYTLPLQLRTNTPNATIAILDNAVLAKMVAANLRYGLETKLIKAVTAIPKGEVDHIFKAACIKPEGEPSLSSADLNLLAANLAKQAQAISLYGQKANQEDYLAAIKSQVGADLGPRRATSSANGDSNEILNGTVAEIVDERNKLQSFMMGPSIHSKILHSAFTFAATGKTHNIVNPDELFAQLSSILAFLEVEDGRDDPHKFKNVVATAIYLSAVQEYDGIFSSKTNLTPQGFHPQRAKAMLEYAFMFHATAHGANAANLVLKTALLKNLKTLISAIPTFKWSQLLEDQYSRALQSVDLVVKRNTLLPFKAIDTILSTITNSLNVSMIMPSDVMMISNLSEIYESMDYKEIEPGESSLYLPLGQDISIPDEAVSSWLTTFSKTIMETEKIVSDISSTLNAIQLSEDVFPSLHVEYPVFPEPDYLTPRYATAFDGLPYALGLPKHDIKGKRILSKYINGIMSYRNVHDKLADERSYRPRFTKDDFAGVLALPKSLVTLPIPSCYLEGENYESLLLRDETMTLNMHKMGMDSSLRYTKSVEKLFFSMDPAYYGYYAYLLSGAFIVLIPKAQTNDKKGRKFLTGSFNDSYDYIIPTAADFFSTSRTIKQEERLLGATVNNVPLTYGVPAKSLITANVTIWNSIKLSEEKAISKETLDKWVMWSDDTEKFGLLPLMAVPGPSATEKTYRVPDGKTVILMNKAVDEDVKLIANFTWSNIFVTLPHFNFWQAPSKPLSQLLNRVALSGRKFTIYTADVISRPSPADMAYDPQPWAPDATPAAPIGSDILSAAAPLELSMPEVDTNHVAPSAPPKQDEIQVPLAPVPPVKVEGDTADVPLLEQKSSGTSEVKDDVEDKKKKKLVDSSDNSEV